MTASKFCDLHTHSVFSDGTCTPEEIIDQALEAGLSAVALTDHNTVDGLPRFLSAASHKSIDAVAGVEFSVDYSGDELHLLALDVPQKYFSQISYMMADAARKKEESNQHLIASLKKVGVVLDYEQIKAQTPNGKVNRARIALEMTQKGYTTSLKNALDTYLSKSAGHYVEPERLTFWEVLAFIGDIGALSVLAHPYLNLSPESLNSLLPAAKKKGLVGMECYYSLFDNDKTEMAKQAAKAYGLKISGGSDFHGDIKPDIKIGVGKGNLKIPYDLLTRLRS